MAKKPKRVKRSKLEKFDDRIVPAFFTTTSLAMRWSITPTRLRIWRMRDQGPPWTKIGGRALYAGADIIAYEKRGAHK